MSRQISRIRAEFLEDDPRYAIAGGQIYPVLLTSFKHGSVYQEDMQDVDEYPADWRWQFQKNLREVGMAVLASDSNLDNDWRFLSIHRVSDVQLTNFLTCTIGKTVIALNLE